MSAIHVALLAPQRRQAGDDERQRRDVAQPAQPSALASDLQHLGLSQRRDQLLRDGRRIDFRGTFCGH
jgi:hypothetical protein